MELSVAEAGIRRMHAHYANAIWRRDFVTLRDFYTEDTEFRIAGLVHRGRDAVLAFLERAIETVDWVRMDFEHPIVHLDGEVALCRTQVLEENILMKGMGVYWERLVQQDGGWRRRWAMFELQSIERPGERPVRLPQPDYGPPPAMPPLDAVPINHSNIHDR